MDSDRNIKTVKLKRQLNVIHGVGIICGLIVGGGIYIAPKGIILGAGSYGLAIIIWILCGMFCTLGALCYAELGTTFPRSGERYYYLEEMFGPFSSFCYLWSAIQIQRPGSNAVKSLIFAQYVTGAFYKECEVPSNVITIIAICLICIITFINVIRVKWTANGQTFFVSVSLGILLIISIYGSVHICQGKAFYLSPSKFFEGSNTNVGEIVLAFYSGLYAYSGWSALNFLVEELKNPIRNLPKAIFISMTLVTTLYVTVNIAYFAVLGPKTVAETNSVGVLFAQNVMGKLSWLVPVGVAVTTAGSYNSGAIVGSRLAFVGSRRGQFPHILGLINIQFLSPITSLLYQAGLTILMCLLSDVYGLLKMALFIYNLFDFLVIFGMLYLRWKDPDRHRPIRLPLFVPVIYLMCTIFLMVMPVVYQPLKVLWGLILAAGTGIPYYILLQLWIKGNKPIVVVNCYKMILTWTQKVFYCCPQEGGINF